MKPFIPAPNPRERGSVIALVLAFSVIVGTLLAGAVSTAVLLSRTKRIQTENIMAASLAEGATEIAQKQMLTALANFREPPLAGTVNIGGNAIDWTAEEIGPTIYRTDIDGIELAFTPVMIRADVNMGWGHANVSRVVDLTVSPLFQYMVFYDGNLIMSPGPEMTLEGRVHVNGDAFITAGLGLTFDTDYLRTTGQLRRSLSNGYTRSGSVRVKKFDDTAMVAFENADDSTAAGWIQSALDRWDGTVLSGAHGVTEVKTPALEALAPGGYYNEEAALVIRDAQVFNEFGNPVVLPPGVVTERTIYNGRQNTEVTVTDIDIAALNASGFFPSNGLIYAYRTDESVSRPNGFRLVNGAELANNLTVVSENSVFVQGDYNTINKKGAGVIADAVNLLSNAWDDSKSAGNLPVASDTTFNMAFITGDVPDELYNGGLENLPRFHENWSGVTATIRGAFIRLFSSQYATAPWRQYGDAYIPPQRDWRFDTDLLDPRFLPPFTPNASYVRRVLWDDNHAVPFKPSDAALSNFPETPVYDPWNYESTFMDRVLTDPNRSSLNGGYVNTGGNLGTVTPR